MLSGALLKIKLLDGEHYTNKGKCRNRSSWILIEKNASAVPNKTNEMQIQIWIIYKSRPAVCFAYCDF